MSFAKDSCRIGFVIFTLLNPSFPLNPEVLPPICYNTDFTFSNEYYENVYDLKDMYSVTYVKNGDEYKMTTGAYKKAKVYNIYDMAGNLSEWTMEGLDTMCHVLRGDGDTVTLRGADWPAWTPDYDELGMYFGGGFRPSLYIK